MPMMAGKSQHCIHSRPCAINSLPTSVTGQREAQLDGNLQVHIRTCAEDAVITQGRSRVEMPTIAEDEVTSSTAAFARSLAQKIHLQVTEMPTLVADHRCTIRKCAEDAVVAQDRSRVELEACAVTECRGPALDLTQHAQAQVRDSLLRGCSGALHCLYEHAALCHHALQGPRTRPQHRMHRPTRHSVHRRASSKSAEVGPPPKL